MAPGDLLVLYTDGVTEAEDGRDGFFGSARLLEVAQAHRDAAAPGLEAALLAAVHEFRGDFPQTDDITVVVIQRGG